VRRILASLFVIAAVVGIGVFATGAFFTDSVSITGQTFTTESADLKFGQCGEIGDDCTGVSATETTVSIPSSFTELTGPDQLNSGCLVVQNMGPYLLHLTGSVAVTDYSHWDMTYYFEVAADRANDHCNPLTGLIGWQSVATADANSPFAFGDLAPVVGLAPGERLYLVLYNRWNSADNQNYLQNGMIELTTQIDGQTN
jgi:hypothetical protein